MVVPDTPHSPESGRGATRDPQPVIAPIDERVGRDTVRADLVHAVHELVWNEQGASTVGIGPRVWSITPRIGLWVPAETPHTARLPAGTWYRAARFGVWATPRTPRWERPYADGHRPARAERAGGRSAPAGVRHAGSTRLGGRGAAGARHVLGEWATRLGVSARTIARALEREVGLGFTDWVTSVRVQRAVELLVAGEPSEDVAAEVGYRSLSAFGAAFKRSTGVTPVAFRAR